MIRHVARRRGVAVTVVVALGAAVLAACAPDPDDSIASPDTGTGGEPNTSAPKAPPIPVPADLEDHTGEDTVTITVQDNAFEPRYITVSPGTQILWINEGNNQHNVTPAVEGSFTGVTGEELAAGNEPSASFADAGEFPYYCSFHGTKTVGQTGFILVEDA